MARCALWGWCVWGFSDDSVVKNPSAVQKTQVPSLGWEAPLEEEMATHSRILVWRGQEDKRTTVHGVSKSQTQLSN